MNHKARAFNETMHAQAGGGGEEGERLRARIAELEAHPAIAETLAAERATAAADQEAQREAQAQAAREAEIAALRARMAELGIGVEG